MKPSKAVSLLTGKRKEVARLILGVGCKRHSIPEVVAKLSITEKEAKSEVMFATLELLAKKIRPRRK